ncbi:hypothetical protein P5663_06900 [Priestia flexa]|uniref:hypothetical protein n=1 Tax=Priestia flexa TaxID=86664 RepID=UPI00240D7EFB|nr:hypothetical protein [Priestia flexa]WEZ09567.1 hypothetical protein P5663_06900 [Priestia flexa]
MEVKVNFNEIVKVRLTKFGIDILKSRHMELNNLIQKRGGKGLEEFKLKIDDDGYSSFQIWELMSTFGEYMYMSSELPFKADMVITK